MGLTSLQAKVYLTLVSNGRQTIKGVARIAKIDRSNIYHDISGLEQRALVKKIIGIPNMYEAIPIEDGISLLLAQRQREFGKTRKELKKIIQTFSLSEGNMPKTEDISFFVVPRKTAFMKWTLKHIQNVQVSNDTISNFRRFSQALECGFFAAHKRAVERGARTRVILEEPRKKGSVNKPLELLMNHPNFQVRFTRSPPEALGGCFDNKEVGIVDNPAAEISESSLFFTNHPSFVIMFRSYFYALWNSAEPPQLESQNHLPLRINC